MLSVIPEDRSKDAWIAAYVEAGVGSIWAHPNTSPRIGSRRRRQGEDLSRKHWTTLNRLRTSGRSVQTIHEEVGPGGQFSV